MIPDHRLVLWPALHLRAGSGLAAFVVGGFYDDIPGKNRRGFRDQVMKALPFPRNKLGAHGQGNKVIQAPKAYAQPAVHLAGSFIQFVTS